MTRICLDTSAYSHFRHGDIQVVDAIDSAEWVGVPAIVIGELEAAFALGARRASNQQALSRFLDETETLPVDATVGRIYGEILVALRAAGTPIPTNDIWIAATAARHGATILTYDARFSRIQRVGSMILGAG